MNEGDPFRYRCSICKQIISAERDNMSEHLKMERAKPDWPGHMTWTRVDAPQVNGSQRQEQK